MLEMKVKDLKRMEAKRDQKETKERIETLQRVQNGNENTMTVVGFHIERLEKSEERKRCDREGKG